MSAAPKSLARALLMFVGVAIAFLLFEGIYSVATGGSVAGSLLRGEARQNWSFLDEERLRAALQTEGEYALDLDPFVGMKMKGDAEFVFNKVVGHTDAQSLRRRVGPPAAANAARIVVLGDSIAFGFGVADDQTIAHYLEAYLADTAGTGTPRPVVRTVACPGWTLNSSVRFCLNHLEDLDPDVVIMLPVDNDIDDGDSVTEAGHRSLRVGLATGGKQPHRSLAYGFMLAHGLRLLGRTTHVPNELDFIKRYNVLSSGVTPESRRRYSGAVATLEDLHTRLGLRDARLAVVLIDYSSFKEHLVHFMGDTSPLVRLGLFKTIEVEDQLVGNPHFNARTNKSAAWRIARLILAKAWVPGLGARPLAEQPERFRGNLFALPTGEELRRERAEWAAASEETVSERVDMTDGQGAHQVYGGLTPEGDIGLAAHLVVRKPGVRELELRIKRLDGTSGLYPLELEVILNGIKTPVLTVPPPDGANEILSFRIVVPSASKGYVEVLLSPSHWIAIQQQGTSKLSALQLVSVEAK